MFLSFSGRGKAGILLRLFGLLEGGLLPDLLRTGNEIIDVGHDWLLRWFCVGVAKRLGGVDTALLIQIKQSASEGTHRVPPGAPL